MITAGMDTTAISVEWALAELVRNPDVQAKAQDELDQVSNQSEGNIVIHSMTQLGSIGTYICSVESDSMHI